MNMRRLPPLTRSRGFTLIEVLVSLLVFSLGVLAMVGLQASAVRMSTDARDRGTATFMADQLLGRLLIANKNDAISFRHNPDGASCSPTSAASTHPVITDWLREVRRHLPNATDAKQQIKVDPATGDVTVVLCWQRGGDANATAHTLQVNNRVQWQ
jgi:type IV pilus assembly protein PilV